MSARKKTTDPAVMRILETLHREYRPKHPKAQIGVYRYNVASIRVRIIDPEFAGKNLTERDDELWAILQTHLPEDTCAQINLLLLLAPEETDQSLMNLEFENPTPTRL